MAKSQENGITILLGLKVCRVDKITEEEGGIIAVVRARQGKSSCPRCGSIIQLPFCYITTAQCLIDLVEEIKVALSLNGDGERY